MDRIPFTGFDGFLLTLEKNYSQLGSEGNVCRYVIDLDGSLSQEELQKLLDSNLSLEVLYSLVATKPNPFLVPYWKSIEKEEKLKERKEKLKFLIQKKKQDLKEKEKSQKQIKKEEERVFYKTRNDGR